MIEPLADMSAQEREVWEWLVAHHAGAENAAPRGGILARYNIYKIPKLSDREFRAICAALVTRFSLAVCTTSEGGYYVARTPNELARAVAELEARAVSILDRARALRNARPLEAQGRLW